MSANTTTTPQPGLPTPAQLLEPLTTDLSTATTTTTPGTDDAVQAAVQGFTDRLLRAAAAQPPQAQVQDTETQTQTQTQTPAEEHRKESIAHFVWTAYNDLLDAAQRTPPARQGRLLDFVERLRETVVKGEDGQVLVYEGGELWEGLPSLGWVVRDRWNFDSSDPKTTAEQRTEWENLNAFVAQLTTRADGDDPLDFTLLGLWVMRDAFEAENGVGSDTAVRVASLWVRFAGPLLRELSSNGLDFSAKLGVAEGKYADRGWKGFNDERWEAWGDELKVAQAKLASDETVQGAAKAMAGVL